MTYGWAGTAAALIAADPRATAHILAEQHRSHYRDAPSGGQQDAWRHALEWLTASLHALDGSGDWGVVLEYELPFEGGRRPDAVVLANDAVLVLGKQRPQPGRTSIRSMPMHATSWSTTRSAEASVWSPSS